ncbi:hypothetical protein K474DRAFT_1064749 [Panus rudis PR-1116 ss-1]|nr:hypothetical protein K474DRAFT_1064749 [Panus rudis PR-1116 ss-1]
MTLTILMSFSVLALVVTARPILPRDNAQPETLPTPVIQDVVQAIFQLRTQSPPNCLPCHDEDEVDIHFTSAEEQSAVLSSLDELDTIKAVVPIGLDGVLSEDEKKLYDILISSSSRGSLNELEGGERIPEEIRIQDEQMAKNAETLASSANDHPVSEMVTSHRLFILTLSCLAAFVTMGCIAVAIYAHKFIREYISESRNAWDILPRLARHRQVRDNPHDNGSETWLEKPCLAPDVVPTIQPQLIDMADEKRAHSVLRPSFSVDLFEEERYVDAENFDLDEPLSPVLGPKLEELPSIVIHDHPDPGLIPLPSPTPYSTPPPTPPRTPQHRPLQMRESSPALSPVSKPAWSLRAADAPLLGMTNSSSRSSTPQLWPPAKMLSPSSSTESLSIPGALHLDASDGEELSERPARRAYRAPVPELDIAFALQLRPGLGIGADPAWLVRFLMAMFGWMTILIGNGGRTERRVVA